MRRDFLTLLLVAATTCGCTLHLPESVKSSVSERGAHATRAIRTPVGIYFTSVSFIPGAPGGGGGLQQDSISCIANAISARVYFTSISGEERARLACRAILDAIEYVSRFEPLMVRIEYQAVLVPEGREREESRFNLYPFSRIKPRFVFADAHGMTNAIVGVFAHEYVHLLLDLKNKHHIVTDREESIAYLADVCAQVAIFGSISLENLPGGVIPADESEAVARSSGQGYAVRRKLAPYLVSGVLDSNSSAGSEFLGMCSSSLQNFAEGFKNEP